MKVHGTLVFYTSTQCGNRDWIYSLNRKSQNKQYICRIIGFKILDIHSVPTNKISWKMRSKYSLFEFHDCSFFSYTMLPSHGAGNRNQDSLVRRKWNCKFGMSKTARIHWGVRQRVAEKMDSVIQVNSSLSIQQDIHMNKDAKTKNKYSKIMVMRGFVTLKGCDITPLPSIQTRKTYGS